MSQRLYVKIREEDNVVIAVKDIPAGTQVMEDLPMPTRTTWMGYKNAEGPAGTRNLSMRLWPTFPSVPSPT